MAVGILPYREPSTNFARLAEIPLEQLLWPLADRPNVERVGHLSGSDHLLIYCSSRAFLARTTGLACRVSILLQEPPAIQKRYYRLLRLIGRRYHRILTHNSELLGALANARFLPHGGTFLKAIQVYDAPKERRISIVASKKRTTTGHRLRHRLADWSGSHAPDLELFGYGYNPVEDKSVAHAPFLFSVVVENSRCAGYFTEKLIDSFLCRSLPIYWGAPDIAHFFDPRGMICCHDEGELRSAIVRVQRSDYDQRRMFLEENVQRALKYADYHKNAAYTLAQEFELPSTP